MNISGTIRESVHVEILLSIAKVNECTKVQTLGATLARNLKNARAIETLTTACANVKVHVLLKRTLMTCSGKYTENL